MTIGSSDNNAIILARLDERLHSVEKYWDSHKGTHESINKERNNIIDDRVAKVFDPFNEKFSHMCFRIDQLCAGFEKMSENVDKAWPEYKEKQNLAYASIAKEVKDFKDEVKDKVGWVAFGKQALMIAIIAIVVRQSPEATKLTEPLIKAVTLIK